MAPAGVHRVPLRTPIASAFASLGILFLPSQDFPERATENVRLRVLSDAAGIQHLPITIDLPVELLNLAALVVTLVGLELSTNRFDSYLGPDCHYRALGVARTRNLIVSNRVKAAA